MNVQRLHVLELSTAPIRVADSFGCDENFRNNQSWNRMPSKNVYEMFNYMYTSVSDVKTDGSKGLLLK